MDRRRAVEDFDDKIVSAVSEAFNNIALHAYSGPRDGNADLELSFDAHSLTIRLSDTGPGFEPSTQLEPDLESLPESHMGLVIMSACVDEVSYLRGIPPGPNVLTLTKRYFASEAPAGSGPRRD